VRRGRWRLVLVVAPILTLRIYRTLETRRTRVSVFDKWEVQKRGRQPGIKKKKMLRVRSRMLPPLITVFSITGNLRESDCVYLHSRNKLSFPTSVRVGRRRIA
jgi:hypothetical protein